MSLLNAVKKKAQAVKSALLGDANVSPHADFSAYADVRDKRELGSPINPAEEDYVVEDLEPPHSVYEVIISISQENIPLLSSTSETVKCFSVNLRGRKMRDSHCQFVQEAFTVLHKTIETNSPFKSSLPPSAVATPNLQEYYGATDVLIRSMDVGGNQLTADGLRVFINTIALCPEGAQAAPQTALKIRLDHNRLDDEACEVLADVLKQPNSRLQSLDLSFNKGITDRGVTILCRALVAQQVDLDLDTQPVKLKSLALVGTGITDAGLREVLEAVSINRHVHRLDCHRTRSTTEENPIFLNSYMLGELITYLRRNRGEQIEYAVTAKDVPINDARPDVIQSHTEKLIERSNSRLMSYQVMCSENGWRVERDVLESQIRRLVRENNMCKQELEALQKGANRDRIKTEDPEELVQERTMTPNSDNADDSTIVDPSRSVISWDEEPVATNVPYILRIELKDKQGNKVEFGGQEFDIYLINKHGKRIHRDHFSYKVKDNFDGTYEVTFALDHLLDKGEYSLNIRLAALEQLKRKHLNGSPLQLNVVNGPVPVLCHLVPMQQNRVKYGDELRYVIQLHDRNGLTVDHDQDGRAGNVSFQLFANRYDSYDPYKQELILETQKIAVDREHGSGEHLSGTYELSFVPDKPGMYVIEALGRNHVTGSHEHLLGSPHLITVHPLAYGPFCRARGPALAPRQDIGANTYFTIYAMDRDGNHIRNGGDKFVVSLHRVEDGQEIENAIGQKGEPRDDQNGTYRVDINAEVVSKITPGKYHYHVKYVGKGGDSQHVFGSPFEVFYNDDPAFSPEQSSLVLEEGMMYENLTHYFRVKCCNSKGHPVDVNPKSLELIVKMIQPQGEPIQMKVSQISDFDSSRGELLIKWRPPMSGKFAIQIHLDDPRRGMLNVANTPFTFVVKPTAESPSASHTQIQWANADGADRCLYVVLRNSQNKPIGRGGDHVNVVLRHVNSGDELKTTVKDLKNGAYQCNFTLVFRGEYQILVIVNDQSPRAESIRY